MIHTWSIGVADDHMGEEILIRTGDRVRRHPWWLARARLTRALLARRGVHPPACVLDAGCGWGVTLEALEAAGHDAFGLDVSPRILAHLDRPGRKLIEADLSRPLPTDVETFDAVLALDVIEHLDDDGGAVAALANLVAPGGLLIVSVPAQPSLFSEFDAIQGHRRRYLPESLRAAFNGSGLAVESIFWWGAWMTPILRRRLGRDKAQTGDDPAEVYLRHLSLPPWPGPLVLRAAYALEQPLALRGLLSTGTSLFAVARRPV
ncbi:class I SAM-dependent methyltransferase [Paludisphaera mucosa]|uniref:Methyltransferase domain-containing protein n=1 Tax=Paludisphaera mucosa TaxID=3030827 RepID=A0ABT6F771_9BACT|nr:class I SAM-dependent methyltransferase [Paludisphaera mucosa]MDG3003441.1 methyltransferase domain-containing protein [Paludisphaera mucosa]